MIFGYLADMVATIPSWITMIVKQDELDIAPKDGPSRPPEMNTSAEYFKALDEVGGGRAGGAEGHERRIPGDEVAAAGGAGRSCRRRRATR